MAPYDSDSSSAGDDDGDYTETGVLLGYASTDPTDDPISHLGGQPTWLDSAQPPSVALARCKVCRDVMRLLLQLDGDLPDRFTGHQRRLYIFNCARKTCKRKAGSVRAVRGIRVDWNRVKTAKEAKIKHVEDVQKTAERKEERRDFGRELFGSGSASAAPASSNNNPFASPGSNPPAASSANPFSSLGSPSSLGAKAPQKPVQNDLPTTFAAKLALDSPPPAPSPRPPFEPWPSEKDLPAPYPTYYLDADYETLDASPPNISSSSSAAKASSSKFSMDDKDEDPSAGGGGKSNEKETFESSLDKTFQRFADRVAQNPLQVLRYEFGGMPLLYSSTDAVGKLFPSHHHQHLQSSPQRSTLTTTTTTTTASTNNKIPPCENCGAPRTFELQIMPHAITELEPDQDLAGDESGVLEWGTLLLGTCQADCVPGWMMGLGDGGGSQGAGAGGGEVGGEGRDMGMDVRNERGNEVGYLEEWVGVQWE